MLRKLIFRHQDKRQLFIAVLGSFAGMTFLVTAIHYLIKVNEFGEGADILGPNTVIVQKKVSNSNTLNMAKTDFSDREINLLRQQPFVTKVQPVITNNFNIFFETADPLIPPFKTDVFIQTVDTNFLDFKSPKWNWKPTDKYVPIIMPREFLVMLNTFMSAAGIPQVSDELAMDVKFKFRLSNDTLREYVDVRLVGFTNEVSSILVPQAFMSWANDRYAKEKEQKITQLMIEGVESEFGQVESMLKERHLETKNAQLIVGRLKSMVSTLIWVVLSISIIAVFLSGLVLIQYLQLLLSKNSYEIRTLLRQGFHPKQLITLFVRYFCSIFGLIAAIGFAVFVLLKLVLDDIFADGGLYIDQGFTATSMIALIVAYAIFALTAFMNSKKGIIGAEKG